MAIASAPTHTHRFARPGHRDAARSRPVIVREGRGTYDPIPEPDPPDATPAADPVVPPALARLNDLPVPDDPTAPVFTDGVQEMIGDGHDAHPFGLPVLSEVPQLAMLLADLRQVDRLLAGVIDAIVLLEDTGLAEATTGVGLDTWLTIVGRRTGADTRMLRTTATTMRRSPTLHEAFRTGTVSWAQVRSVVLAIRPLPRHLDDTIDAAIADALDNSPDAEPDSLTRTIRWHLAAIDPTQTERDQDTADQAEYLAMQPRLDGTGGRIWGELGPTNFAILDAALNVGPSNQPVDGPGGVTSSPSVPAATSAPTPIAAAGRIRLHRLIDHLEHSLSRHLTPGRRTSSTVPTNPPPGPASSSPPAPRPSSSDPSSAGPSTAGPSTAGPMRSRMQLLLRTDLSTLLDRDLTPASLLTTLLGGHVRVTADTARRLLDERGADLRTVILDDTGTVVGVARRTRIAPGWLKDATLALHDTCATPGCDTASRDCETDHARPWQPARPHDPTGRTDIDQLGPGCKRHNLTKERDGWSVTQQPDGTRRWRHPRTGLTTTVLPVPSRPAPSIIGPDPAMPSSGGRDPALG